MNLSFRLVLLKELSLAQPLIVANTATWYHLVIPTQMPSDVHLVAQLVHRSFQTDTFVYAQQLLATWFCVLLPVHPTTLTFTPVLAEFLLAN